MTTHLSFRRLVTAVITVAVFLVGTMLAAGPASAEPYGTRTCNTAPPFITCGAGTLEPHSSQGWLEVKLNPTGALICHVTWTLYDITNNWAWAAGGVKALATSSTTFKVNGLSIGHQYRLEAWSSNCVTSIRLRNWT
ncbi:hypothetical protein [Herbidospora sp. RD11066]